MPRSLIGTLLDRTPVKFAPNRKFTFPTQYQNNPEAQMRAMGGVGTLFSIVNKLSNSVSQTDWKLYRTKDGRGAVVRGERQEVSSHLALDVWNKPNSFYTRQELVETFQQHLDLTGEGWWVLGTNPVLAGVPLEIWPVRPDKMGVVPSAENFLAGYTYSTPDGEKVPLDLNEVVQLKMPNPIDPYRGMGPVQSLLSDLDSAKYSSEWNRNFFLNSAEPGGIIEVSDRLSDDEFDEMSARWEEQHKGVAKAHRVAILEQGKWVDRKYSMRDMQFVQLREVTRNTIMEAFGISRHMLGITEDVNRANAEAGEFIFTKWLVLPRLERIKQALNNDFLPLFGETGKGVEFDYVSPVTEDKQFLLTDRSSRVEAAVRLTEAGYDSEEVFIWLELPAFTRTTAAVDREVSA